ncbi:MAG: molecular chaperone GrpE [Patescibacteria group bacterium]|nr:molecular chaperone GrpE [Patescibacteria group bacterium]
MPKKPTIAELQQQIAELTEALQRERADVINVRRQHGDQMANLQSHIKVQVIEELLPVVDNFERALKHVPAELADNSYVQGVQGVVKQFESTLEQMGVQRIKTVGEVFDPTVHEAVTMDQGDGLGEGAIEVVTEELQAGYKLNDTVIRHAMVKVAMKKGSQT